MENPFFKEFCQKLKPSYKLPSQQNDFTKILVPSEFKRVEQLVENATNSADFLSISSDGFTDVNENRIVNILVHAQKPYLYESIDTLDEPHTDEYIAKIFSQVHLISCFLLFVLFSRLNELGRAKL